MTIICNYRHSEHANKVNKNLKNLHRGT